MNAAFGNLGSSLALGLVCLAGGSATFAGDVAPELQVAWTVDGSSETGSLTGQGLGAGLYSYAYVSAGDGFQINWNFLVTDNGSAGGFEILASSLGFENTSGGDSTFEIDVLLPVTLDPGLAFYGGSMAGSLSGGANGGSLASAGGALFNAFVDDQLIATLGDAPFSLTTDPFGSAELLPESFGDPIPSLEAAAAQESMAIGMDFVLGNESTFAVTSNFVAQVPAPGAVALLGLAGLASRRRRA
ncbi:MAG: hypothetical protein VX672_06285 [Planctomycetota bacterium]|nr:hypothetical protein [Planctomycetota bacterium]